MLDLDFYFRQLCPAGSSVQTVTKNMKIINNLIAVLLCSTYLLACKENIKKSNSKSSTSTTELAKKPAIEIYGIEGEDIIIRSGAGNKFDKVINEKATRALGKTEYCQVVV